MDMTYPKVGSCVPAPLPSRNTGYCHEVAVRSGVYAGWEMDVSWQVPVTKGKYNQYSPRYSLEAYLFQIGVSTRVRDSEALQVLVAMHCLSQKGNRHAGVIYPTGLPTLRLGYGDVI